MRSEAQWRALIVAEALSWESTPYHPGAAIKGAGVDCALILAEVYSAVGLIPKPDPGPYSQQWMLHREEEIYLGWIRRYAREIPVEAVKPGDVVAWKLDGCLTYSHAAIVIDPPLVIHAVFRSAVIPANMEREEKLRLSPKLAFSLFGEDGRPLKRKRR